MKSKLTFFLISLLTMLFGNVCAGPINDQWTGVYSSLRYDKVSGDLLGVEIFLLNTRNGPHVIFQSAEGGAASVPVVVDAFIQGNKIEFSLPASSEYSGKFVGILNKSKLIGSFEKGYSDPTHFSQKFELKKSKSYWQ